MASAGRIGRAAGDAVPTGRCVAALDAIGGTAERARGQRAPGDAPGGSLAMLIADDLASCTPTEWAEAPTGACPVLPQQRCSTAHDRDG